MTSDVKRLLRLTRAQSDLARLLESRLAAERQRQDRLQLTRVETTAALEGVSRAGLSFHAAALRRLAEIDTALLKSEQTVGELLHKLLQARTRKDALLQKASETRITGERKQLFSDLSDAVELMREKAPGKRGVLS